MNLFFLVSFSAFGTVLAVTLLAVLIWKDLSIHFRSIGHRIARGFDPLADAARLDRASRRFDRAILQFEPIDWNATGSG